MGSVCILLGAGVSVFGGYLASKVDNRFEEFLALFSGICGGSLIIQAFERGEKWQNTFCQSAMFRG